MITTHFTESSYPHQTKLGLLRIRVITSALLCQLTTVTHTHTHIHTPPLRRVHFSRVKLEERSFNSFCNQPAPSSVRVCVCVCVCVRLIFEMKSDVKMMPGDRLTLVAVEDAADEDSER